MSSAPEPELELELSVPSSLDFRTNSSGSLNSSSGSNEKPLVTPPSKRWSGKLSIGRIDDDISTFSSPAAVASISLARPSNIFAIILSTSCSKALT